jgi:phosphoadenosine phosphosulfate reductase
MKRVSYTDDVDYFIDRIVEKSNRKFDDAVKEKEFIETGGWKVRNNGRDLRIPVSRYEEIMIETELHIIVGKNKSWMEWSKTIGELTQIDEQSYKLLHDGKPYAFVVLDKRSNLEFIIDGKPKTKQDILFLSAFRSVLKKSAYCIKCKECEANCNNGHISLYPELRISDDCEHCLKCHKIDSGCLLYNSIKVLKGEQVKMSIDSYASFGVEKKWVDNYLFYKEDFWKSGYNDLGSMKITALKRFLRDAKLKLEVGESDPIALAMNRIFDSKSVSEEVLWGLIVSNVAYAPQLNWFLKNTNLGERYLPDEIKMKINLGSSKGRDSNIVSSLKNIFTKTPIGQDLGLGICEMDNRSSKLMSISRSFWKNPDPRIILYGLYKFAEACGDYYQFTLTRLMNYSVDSDGVSPSQIFGLERDIMEKLLNGLAINYPEFITVAFTLDLENITLRSEKTTRDVLELF